MQSGVFSEVSASTRLFPSSPEPAELLYLARTSFLPTHSFSSYGGGAWSSSPRRPHGATPPRSAFPTKAAGKVSAVILGKGGERGTSLRRAVGRESDCPLRNLNLSVPSRRSALVASAIRKVWQEVSLMERMVS